MEEKEFLDQKKKLRQYFKQLKAGMISWEDIPDDFQVLLMKYYGIDG